MATVTAALCIAIANLASRPLSKFAHETVRSKDAQCIVVVFWGKLLNDIIKQSFT